MANTHDSIAEAVSEFCEQPTFCRRPTVEIDPLLLEQLRAQSSHGLSIRNRKPTAQYTATPPEGVAIPVEDAIAAMDEFAAKPTRQLAQDEIDKVRATMECTAWRGIGRAKLSRDAA